MKLAVRSWAAWSPGLADPDRWLAWARRPVALASEGTPDVSFLPAMLRRRCSRLTKMMLHAAFAASPERGRAELGTVFASRHGAIHLAVRIIDAIYRGEAVSPMQFSHSVHNAPAGQFSMATGCRAASSSIAAGADTFAHAFVEACVFLERRPSEPVLLVIGDEPVPPLFTHLVDEPEASYSLALRLAAGDGPGLDFSPSSPASGGCATRKWPDALEFLRWWLSDEPELRLEHAGRAWSWRRSG